MYDDQIDTLLDHATDTMDARISTHNDRHTWKRVYVDLDKVFKAPPGMERRKAIALARCTIENLRRQYRVMVATNRAKGSNLAKADISDWLDFHGIRCDGVTAEKPRHRYDHQGIQQ